MPKKKPAPKPAKRSTRPQPKQQKRTAPKLPPLPPAPRRSKAETFLPPKITAYKFSPRNKTDAAYRDRLRVLKDKYGAETKIRANAKLTPQRKAAITRLASKYTGYLNPDNRFQFVKLDRKTKKAALRTGTVSRDQITGTGAFIQRPSGKKSRINFKTNGELVIRTGKRVSTFATFKTTQVLADPESVVAEMKRRGASRVFVNVRGFRSRTIKKGYTAKQLLQYLSGRIMTFRNGVEQQQKSGKGVFASRISFEFVGGKGGFKK